MHEQRSGTVIEFLDEFEREAMAKFPFHKFTIVRQKAMDAQFSRHRCPGWYVTPLQRHRRHTAPAPPTHSSSAANTPLQSRLHTAPVPPTHRSSAAYTPLLQHAHAPTHGDNMYVAGCSLMSISPRMVQ